MTTTEFAHLLDASKHYKTIPIIKSFFEDTLTPVSIFQALRREAVYILESKEPNSDWARYSFIGLNPFMQISAEANIIKLTEIPSGKEKMQSDCLKKVIQYGNDLLKVKTLDKKLGFTGGAVGYLSYDFIPSMEKVPMHLSYRGEKTAQLLYCEDIVVCDHVANELHFIHYIRLSGQETIEELKRMYHDAIFSISEKVTRIKKRQEVDELIEVYDGHKQLNVHSNYTKAEFIRHVEKIKDYIQKGDIFQCVLSQRFEINVQMEGFDVYRVLRRQNPSPYLFYLYFEEMELIGSSPERLIQIQDKKLEIHPIAGTRKRGRTEKEDQELAKELMKDEKEQAEHYMLVDLARNDLGRVAKYGTVHTPVMKELVYFSKVMHLISIVKAKLSDEYSPIDALLAAFPAGTVSGAPKVRAMQILQELEPTIRNTYAGAICYIGFDGNIDSCITIRTIQKRGDSFYVQAGAGVVADSVPELEWEETINKASALIETIQVANQYFAKEMGGSVPYV
ncbi:anthranilate synthase component I [Sutcliffiella rhizosphaerae]|uniref:Anthranilate synthase component 1 n=1 Tax=Sutcliffiella rhizosphaerae TaxID=2880967 RepID=A0ABM8YRM0_9BACI|nr:anthranilate synthase component I [Sutcliffiella rhizosphaerae]CAG9622653.1 Anthranilate synthase component 1 [Sutcliffiella rhizosphaerae]